MASLPFTDVAGVRRRILIADDRLDLCGLTFQTRVRAPDGVGAVMGLEGDALFVLLDVHAEEQLVTPYSLADVTSGKVKLEPLPAKSPLMMNSAATTAMAGHRLRTVHFHGREVRVATQRRRGPCPVLALANALALQGRLEVPVDRPMYVTAASLRSALAAYLLQRAGEEADGGAHDLAVAPACEDSRTIAETLAHPVGRRRLWDRVLGDATAPEERAGAAERLLERLYDGMNVNPIFSDIESFAADEPDTALFALAGVRLLHGWVVAAADCYAPLRTRSFGEVVVLAATTPPRSPSEGAAPSMPTESGGEDEGAGGLAGGDTQDLPCLAAAFVAETAVDQMTGEGRARLSRQLADGEVAVLFWHDHFFTTTVLGGRLLVLCSDESFQDKPSFVFSVIDSRGEESGFAKGDGRDIEPIVAAVESRLGNRFTEAAILEASSVLVAAALAAGKDPGAAVSTTAVIAALEKAEAGGPLCRGSGGVGGPPPESAAGVPLASPVSARRPKPALSRPAAASSTVPDALVDKFLEVFPDVLRADAAEYLAKHDNSIEVAIAAYMASL